LDGERAKEHDQEGDLLPPPMQEFMGTRDEMDCEASTVEGFAVVG